MKKQIYTTFHKLIILLLIVFWIFSIHKYLQDEDFSLTSLDGRHIASALKFSSSSEMLRNDFITGEFKSKYPNLGTISIRFKTSNRINEDTLLFRIKESVSNEWYYQAKYKVDQFRDDKLFPFGFPLIQNSKGKTYYFEIVSLDGTKDNAIGLSGRFPSFVSKHVYTKEFLLKNPKDLVYFLVNKFVSIFGDRGVLSTIFVYFLPLFYYLVFTWFGYSPMIPILIIVFSIFLDFLVGETTKSFFPLAIGFAWILPMIKFKIHHKVSAILGLGFLSLIPLFWVFKSSLLAEKTAIYAFLLFISATMQQIYVYYWQIKTVSPKTFWKNLYLEWHNTLKFIYFVAIGEIVISAGYVYAKKTVGKKFLALIIYKLSEPMSKTYIATSEFVANTVLVSVKLLKLSHKYGPYFIFSWLVWLNYYKIKSHRQFYEDFYQSNQQDIFWKGTGQYLTIALVIFVVTFVLFQYKKNLRAKTILAILLLILNYQTSNIIFNATTAYKYDVILYSVSPKRATLWDEVKITGRNFREMPFKGRVYINDVEHMILSWTDRRIIFQADPTKTKTGEVKIIDFYGKESDTIHLDYYDLQTNELIK